MKYEFRNGGCSEPKFCVACGDCVKCFGEDRCYGSTDGKHRSERGSGAPRCDGEVMVKVFKAAMRYLSSGAQFGVSVANVCKERLAARKNENVPDMMKAVEEALRKKEKHG